MKKKILLLATISLTGINAQAGNESKLPTGFKKQPTSGISFTENKGQVCDQNYKPRPDVLFSGTDGQITFHLKNDGISYQLKRVDTWKEMEQMPHMKDLPGTALTQLKKSQKVPNQTTIYRLDINWVNANTKAEITTGNSIEGYNNYYLAQCPDGALNVKSYENVTYQNIYTGIDLKWYQKDGHLKYDYIVAAGADYKQIQLNIEGAEKISINSKGELVLKTPLGEIIEQAPLVMQAGRTLKSKWLITGAERSRSVSYEIQNLNPNQGFVIDPAVRVWGTYYGEEQEDNGIYCSVDASGNVYLAGITGSSNSIATVGTHQSTYPGGYLYPFLAKFNSSGIRLWGTYYGNSGLSESCSSSATDAFGNVYLAGFTSSTVGIASGGHQNTYGGGFSDSYLIKFNSQGMRQWGTYYGGDGDDFASTCICDASGNVYLAGNTTSTVGIASGGHQNTIGIGVTNAFLIKFNGACIRQWGTYYGGANNNNAISCAVDPTGNVFMAGNAYNPLSGIASGGHQNAFGGGQDAYLAKFNSSGVRQWGTYYGGNDVDVSTSCSTDGFGNVYLSGQTNSTNNISSVGHQNTFGGGQFDAFSVKFNAAGVRQWGTYYGASGIDVILSCSADVAGNLYAAGITNSTDSIASGGHQNTYGGGIWDGFLVKFNGVGIRQWGTYYGASGFDVIVSCSTDAFGNVYSVGTTTSIDSIAIAGHQNTGGDINNFGFADAFLVKFKDCSAIPNVRISSNKKAVCSGKKAKLTANGATTYLWSTGSASNPITVNPTVTTTYTVTGTIANGCSAQAVITQSVKTCRGKNDNDDEDDYEDDERAMNPGNIAGIDNLSSNIQNSSFQIYPNPNSGNFTFETLTEIDVTITNTLGQIVLQKHLAEGKNKIDLNEQAKGIYFVKTKNSNFKILKE